MVEYICETCNKIFNHKGHFTRHKNRKISCKSENGIMNTNEHKFDEIIDRKKCLNCNKSFSNRSSMIRHFRFHCKIKKNKNKNDDENQKMYKMIKALNTNLENKNMQLTALQKHVNQLTVNNNIYNNYNIVINNYGNENMLFIKDNSKKYKKFITGILQQGIPGLQKYINYKYCNPKHKENLTIKYTNKRQKDIYIRQNDKWISHNKNDIINDIYNWENSIEEILNIYEHFHNKTHISEMDNLQKNFVNALENVYEEEYSVQLDKAKEATLNNLYDCYISNKILYDDM